MDNNDEDAILIAAELILDAVALSEAMLACDFEEARFRARLVQSHSLTRASPPCSMSHCIDAMRGAYGAPVSRNATRRGNFKLQRVSWFAID